MQSFRYDAIPTPGMIRVFDLNSGKGDEPLSCNLRTVRTDEAPPYEAISYVWSDPARTAKLMCSGKEMFITWNLSDGLRRFRRTSDTRLLWADAICIDQSNVHERGAQVAMMGLIYHDAIRVLVWLGPDEDENATRSVFDLFESIWQEGNSSHASGSTPLTYLNTLQLVRDFDALNYALRIKFLPSSSSALWQCLPRFFACPWFTRI
jgi:Heterokaryon incompatibility protein (HET)